MMSVISFFRERSSKGIDGVGGVIGIGWELLGVENEKDMFWGEEEAVEVRESEE